MVAGELDLTVPGPPAPARPGGPRVPLLGWLALVVICLLAGMPVVAGLAQPGPVVSVGSPFVPAPAVELPGLLGPGLGLGHNLVIGRTCPALAREPATIAVTFELINYSQAGIAVVGVEPWAQPGLRESQPVTAGGSCGLPGTEQPEGSIDPVQSRLFTIWFSRPASCTGSAGRAGTVRVRVQQLAGTAGTPVTAEAGTLYFDRCPDPGPTGSNSSTR